MLLKKKRKIIDTFILHIEQDPISVSYFESTQLFVDKLNLLMQ